LENLKSVRREQPVVSGTEILPDLAGASIFQGSLNLKRKINTIQQLFCYATK
jgi:hypothetical protein